jgi:hypothetical protein
VIDAHIAAKAHAHRHLGLSHVDYLATRLRDRLGIPETPPPPVRPRDRRGRFVKEGAR